MSNKWTEEDDEGLRKAEEVHHIIERLSTLNDSNAVKDADDFLKKVEQTEVSGQSGRTPVNRTVINKSATVDNSPSPVCNGAQGDADSQKKAFMMALEADAKQRAERKVVNRKRAEELKQRGNEYYRACDYLQAKRCYSEAMKICRDWDILYTNLAMTCNKLGEYEETLTHCKWAERLNEQNTKSMLHRGKAMVGLGRPIEALEIYKNVLEIDPKLAKTMKEYVSEAEAALSAKDEEKKATEAFEELSSNQSEEENPERFVVRLICEVARPGMEPIYYSGGLRLIAQSMNRCVATSQTLFRAKGGFTLLERSDTKIGKSLTTPLLEQDKLSRDILRAVFELGVVLCEACEENQRRMLAIKGLPARLAESLKHTSKSAGDIMANAALSLLFVISQSESGRKSVNDWLNPSVILPKLVLFVQQGSGGGVGQHAASLLNNMALSPRFQSDMLTSGNVQITEAVESLLQNGGGHASACLASCLNCVMNLCGNITIRRRLSTRLSFLKATTAALERYLPLHADERHTNVIQALLGLLINVSTGVDKTSAAIALVSPKIVTACSKVLATDHLTVHRDRLFTLLSIFLPVCHSDFVVAWCVSKTEGVPIIEMARRIICHETGEHPATSVAIRVLAAATLHHTETRYMVGDDEEMVTRLAFFVQSSQNEVLAGNAALCLGHCIEDTCLAEHLTNTDIILGLLRRCSKSERTEAQTNYGLLVAKLAQANPKHRERVSELRGFEVIHSATRMLRTC